jgi:hypothetical protein
MENQISKLPLSKLPSISELINSDILALDEINQLNILLNQQPPQKWLKKHPMTNQPYLPIERVEYLLTKLFFRWKVEILQTQLIGNSVVVSVRLHYFNPITNEWEWQDGIGAAPLQTDKNAGAIEFNKLKSAAVMMAAPAAKSYAVKDAAEQIGAIFGKNINRADKANYDNLAQSELFNKELPELFQDTPEWEQAIKSLKNGYTIEQLEKKFSITDLNKSLLETQANETI